MKAMLPYLLALVLGSVPATLAAAPLRAGAAAVDITPKQFPMNMPGGYETWIGTNQVQEDASVLITDPLLAMLAELHQQP